MRSVSIRLAVLGAFLASSVGCNIAAPLMLFFRPRDIQKAQFVFPPHGKIAVLIDRARADDVSPVFDDALHQRLVEYFHQYGSRAQLLPQRKLTDLRRRHADFHRWSTQRVGRELEVDYVLQARIESLELRSSADNPVLAPRVSMRLKVIAVDHPPGDARVFPAEKEGYPVECRRMPSEAGSPAQIDEEIAKLGKDTAYWVMMPFFDVDLEEKTPVER